MSEIEKVRVESGAEPKGMEFAQMDERSVDETLRMIARVPAPEGLEERVKAGLQLAEMPGRVLAWPAERDAARMGLQNSWVRSGWARGAAAAAIALVVAGGGWGIYARVGPAQSAKAGALPVAQPGGAAQTGAFGEAGAMRRPQTLAGPKLPEPKGAGPAAFKPTGPNAEKPAVHAQGLKARIVKPDATQQSGPIQ